MNSSDPRHPPVTPRPMPAPAKPSGLVDPLVATSHAVGRPTISSVLSGDKVRLEDEPIELVADDDQSAGPSSAAMPKPGDSFAARRIVALGEGTAKLPENWKRQTVRTGNGACRVKSFHGKYSDEGIRYLDHAVNTWLDAHPDVEVKFVTSTVNQFEGKIREPALVLNLWY